MTAALASHAVQPTSALQEAAQERGALLVATDGSESADAAVRAAHAISMRTGQRVTLLAVQEPLPVVSPEVNIAITNLSEAERRAATRQAIDEQLARLSLDALPLRIITGDPAATIVRVAADIGAELVIMGLGEHGFFERIFGDETVIKVLRLGAIPVLAVAPGFAGSPKRVLGAVDFSASSGRALRLAAAIVPSGTRFTLAHVVTREADPLAWTAADAGHVGTVGRAFDWLEAESKIRETATVERRVLHGNPERELQKLNEDLQPDLIVAGSHGRNFLTRLRLGSVSRELVRKARCSVLVAPPQDAPGYLEEMPEERGRFAFYEWSERLEEFTRRNAGRTARLEVIDPELGAQLQENNVRFQGASFDSRDGRIQLMFESSGGHLTRNIGGVTAIQMLRDWSGGDAFLRVAHGRGQTLLTLV